MVELVHPTTMAVEEDPEAVESLENPEEEIEAGERNRWLDGEREWEIALE